MRARKWSAQTFERYFLSLLVLTVPAIVPGLTSRAFDSVPLSGTNGTQGGTLSSQDPPPERINQVVSIRTGSGACPASGGNPLTSIEANVANIQMSIGLGCDYDNKRDCSGVELLQTKISSDVYTPESMPFPTNRKWIELIPDTTRQARRVGDSYNLIDGRFVPSHVIHPVRQVRIPTALVDIIVINQWEYDLRFYRPENIGPKQNGLYTVSKSPFVIYKFKNPNPPAINRLQISTIKNGIEDRSEYFYDEAQDLWVLSRNGNVITTKRSVINASDPCERIETRIDRDSGGTTKTIKVYRGFAWGQELVKTIEDADGKALTTTYTFYEDPSRPHYRHLKTMTLPNGRVLHGFIPE